MIFSLAGDPRAKAGELTTEGPNFTHAAALAVAVFVERKHAFCAHKIHALLGVGESILDVDFVVLLHGVKELIGFGVETAGVQGEDAVRAAGEVGVFDESNVFSTGEGDADVAAECGQCVVHDLQGGCEVEFAGDGFPIELLGGGSFDGSYIHLCREQTKNKRASR